MFRQHSNREFERELVALHERLRQMASRVEDMICEAMKAFVERNRTIAKRVIAADHAVNQDEVEIDELCLAILATRQPVASDLRFVTISMKMVTDLERIADLAVSLAFRALDLQPDLPADPHEEPIPQLAGDVRAMVGDAIRAFLGADAALAREVIDRDDEIDESYHTTYRAILNRMLGEPEFVEHGIRLQRVCKYLERMADHATNLAEQVVYLVKGLDIRHPGKRAEGDAPDSH